MGYKPKNNKKGDNNMKNNLKSVEKPIFKVVKSVTYALGSMFKDACGRVNFSLETKEFKKFKK